MEKSNGGGCQDDDSYSAQYLTLVSVYASQHPYRAGTAIIAVVQMRALRLYRDPETLRVWLSVRALEPDCLGLNPSVGRFFLGNLQQVV